MHLFLHPVFCSSVSLLLSHLFFLVYFSHVLPVAFGKKTGFALLCSGIIFLKYLVSPLNQLLDIKNKTCFLGFFVFVFFFLLFLPSLVDFAGITLSRCCCPPLRSSVFEHTGRSLEVE